MRATVVVGIDGTKNSEDTLIWAAEAAVARGADLQVVHALGQSVWGLDIEMDRMLEREGTALLVKGSELIQHLLPHLSVRTVLSLDSPARALIAASARAVLVVVGAGQVRRVDRPVTGSRSYQIAAAAHCPVAVVPGLPPIGAHGVVVGVDGSADGVAAVTLAAAEADRTSEGLRVVHAWSDPAMISDGYLMGGFSDRVRELEQVVLAESVAGLGERYPDLGVEQRLVKAAPSDAILEEAQDARLIVVGSRGRRALSRILLGSVSHDVVLGARCPVIVARTRPTTRR